MGRFQNNFTEMFLGWSSTKIAKMVLLCWTKWLQELKIEKRFKRHLQGQWVDFKIILCKCCPDATFPKLLKWFCSAQHNRPRAKNRKTRKTTSPPRLISQFQNNFPEMWMTLYQKMATRAKKKKQLNNISSKANRPISKRFHRNVSWMTLYQIAKVDPLRWTKWPSELKIEKKHLINIFS